MVPTEEGLVVLGGYSAEYEKPIAPVGDAVVVHEDGTLTTVPEPPGAPLASVSASGFDGAVYVAGTRCTSGTLNGDTSALACKPGTPVLERLDLATSAWTELELPADAPAPGGFEGDQTVYAVDGALVYQVADALSGDDRLSSWITRDDGETWKPMPPEPAGGYCAADGKLLSFVADDASADPDRSGALQASDTADAPLEVTVQTFDVAKSAWSPRDRAPADLEVVAGSTSVSCLPGVGAAAFVTTGGTSGAVVVYAVKDGWHVVDDAEGARVMEALPSIGTDLLLPRVGKGDLVRIDASGNSTTVKLPASAEPVAAIGDAILVRTAKGTPAVVTG